MNEILDVDFLNGLLLSIESNGGCDPSTLDKAVIDWGDYYESMLDDAFYSNLCDLITKADKDQLFRISRGFPSYVKVYCEESLSVISGENNG